MESQTPVQDHDQGTSEVAPLTQKRSGETLRVEEVSLDEDDEDKEDDELTSWNVPEDLLTQVQVLDQHPNNKHRVTFGGIAMTYIEASDKGDKGAKETIEQRGKRGDACSHRDFACQHVQPR